MEPLACRGLKFASAATRLLFLKCGTSSWVTEVKPLCNWANRLGAGPSYTGRLGSNIFGLGCSILRHGESVMRHNWKQ